MCELVQCLCFSASFFYWIYSEFWTGTVKPLLSPGSILEGGGQILRMSAALSAISGTAQTVSKIRANRSKPGLRPQHLAGLKLVAQISGGTLEGALVGSSQIHFQPGQSCGGSFKADPGTAGSCCLLAQVS